MLALPGVHGPELQEAESPGHPQATNFLFCKEQFTCPPLKWSVTMSQLKFLLLTSLRNYRQPNGNSLDFPPPNCPQLPATVPSHTCHHRRPLSQLSQGLIPLSKHPHPVLSFPPSAPGHITMMSPLLKTIADSFLVPPPFHHLSRVYLL